MDRNDAAIRDAVLLEEASKFPHRGQVRVACGAIVEEGEPTGTLNLQVNNAEIRALALDIQRKRK